MPEAVTLAIGDLAEMVREASWPSLSGSGCTYTGDDARHGVRLVISDAGEGLRTSIEAVLAVGG